MTQLCECGCGQAAPITRGRPLRFIHGHNARLQSVKSDGVNKLCAKCGEWKPLNEYRKFGGSSDGRQPRCRSCMREADRQYREAGGESFRIRQRDANRRYREANLERIRARTREKFRQYYWADPERFRERVRQAQAADPEKFRTKNRRRRARDRAAVLNHYGWECSCCGSTDQPNIDHINGDGKQHREQERCGNGSGFYSWLIRNGFPGGFQTLCRPCNSSKKDGPRCLLDHAERMAELAAMRGEPA